MKLTKNVRIEEIINNSLVERHSFFQLKHFLIEKEPTIQAKLWRCVRELKARQDSIYSIDLEIEEIEDDIKLIDIEIQFKDQFSEKTAIEKRKLSRRKLSLTKRIEDLKFKLKNLIEECDFLSKTFDELEQIEKIKPFDDTDEQISYWNNKLTEEFNIKMLTGQVLDPDLIKTILALDSKCQIKNSVIGMINNNIKNLTKTNERGYATKNLQS